MITTSGIVLGMLVLAACPAGLALVGAFRDDEAKEAVGLGREEQPMILLPLGRPR